MSQNSRNWLDYFIKNARKHTFQTGASCTCHLTACSSDADVAGLWHEILHITSLRIKQVCRPD